MINIDKEGDLIRIDKGGDLGKFLEVFNRAREGKTIIGYMSNKEEISFYKFENKRQGYEITELKITNENISKIEREARTFLGVYYPEYLELIKRFDEKK